MIVAGFPASGLSVVRAQGLEADQRFLHMSRHTCGEQPTPKVCFAVYRAAQERTLCWPCTIERCQPTGKKRQPEFDGWLARVRRPQPRRASAQRRFCGGSSTLPGGFTVRWRWGR